MATLTTWASTASEQRAQTAWVVWLAGVAAIGFAVRWLWTVPTRPRQLLWDGRTWHVSAARSSAIDASMTGRIDIAIDVGAWMLLKFRPDAWLRTARDERRRVIWLPAERLAAPFEWHALRYTLYGNAQQAPGVPPIPSPGPDA